MRTILTSGGVAALALVVVLGGCTDSAAPDPQEEAQVDLDVAQYVADATADDITLMNTEA